MNRAVLIIMLAFATGAAAFLAWPEAPVGGKAEHFFADQGLLKAARRVARWKGAVAPAPEAHALAAAQPAESPDLEGTAVGLARLERAEESVGLTYAKLASADLLRRWVALSITEIDTDFRPDLSRNRVVNELMKDPSAAAVDLQAAVASLPPEEETERAALFDLAEHVGSHDQALPVVEAMLIGEIGRVSAAGDERRIGRLLDRYTVLIHDPSKQLQFIDAGLASQQDARILDLLRSRQAMLNQVVQTREETPTRLPAADEPGSAPAGGV